MLLKDAYELANDLLAQLSSACLRAVMAGSLSRRQADVGDIDLVCIPATGEYRLTDLFGDPYRTVAVNHLDDALAALYATGAWQLDAIKPANGARLKRLRHAATGLQCDLTITDERRYGYWLAVRTGPKEFAKALVSRALIRKMFFKDGLLHNHPAVYDDKREVRPCPAGDRCLRIIPTLEELDVFTALGLAYIEPRDRTLSAIMRPAPVKAV